MTDIFEEILMLNTLPRSEASSTLWWTCPGRQCCTHRDQRAPHLQLQPLDQRLPWLSLPRRLSLLQSPLVSPSCGTTVESRLGKGGKCCRPPRRGWWCTCGRRTRRSSPLSTSYRPLCQASQGLLRPNIMCLPLLSGKLKIHTFYTIPINHVSLLITSYRSSC